MHINIAQHFPCLQPVLRYSLSAGSFQTCFGRCANTKKPQTYRCSFLINNWNHNMHLILSCSFYNHSCQINSGHVWERKGTLIVALPGEQACVHLVMEESCGSCNLLAEETISSILCPLFIHQSVQQSGWVGLLPALVPLRGCWLHLALWGYVLQLPLEFEDLAIFLWSSCLDSPRLFWSHPRSLLAHGILSMAVFPRGTWDGWDSSMPHTGPGHPEALP